MKKRKGQEGKGGGDKPKPEEKESSSLEKTTADKEAAAGRIIEIGTPKKEPPFISGLRIDSEFSMLMPDMQEDEFNLLMRHIQEEGLRDRLVVWGDLIIDGMNRAKACRMLHIEIPEKMILRKEFESRDKAMLWMLDNQMGKRNLSIAQRRELQLKRNEIAGAMAKGKQKQAEAGKQYGRGHPKELSAKNAEGYDQRKHDAEELNTSEGTIGNIDQVLKSGEEDLKEGLRKGEIKPGGAVKELKKRKGNRPSGPRRKRGEPDLSVQNQVTKFVDPKPEKGYQGESDELMQEAINLKLCSAGFRLSWKGLKGEILKANLENWQHTDRSAAISLIDSLQDIIHED